MNPTSLVVALSRRTVGTEAAHAAAAALADPAFAGAFVDRARRLRVLGLVLVRLEQAAILTTLPPHAANPLRTLLTQIRRAGAGLDLERDRVLVILRRAGVEPVVLKGSGLRRTLYADPAERHASDIDLLVPQDALDASLTAAIAAGYTGPSDEVSRAYRQHHFHLRLTHALGHDLEIHWGLSEPHSRFRLDPAEFLRESMVVPRRDGPPLRLPRPEHMVLHLVLQNVQERFLWFNRLVDVDRLFAATLDVDLLAERAQSMGLRAALAVTLTLTERLLGTEVTEALRARLGPSSVVRLHLGLLAPEDRMLSPERPRPTVDDSLLDLWLLPGTWPRMAALSRTLSVNGLSDPLHRMLGIMEPPGIGRRLLFLVKLAAYQIRLYFSGAASPRHRPE